MPPAALPWLIAIALNSVLLAIASPSHRRPQLGHLESPSLLPKGRTNPNQKHLYKR
ncbi:MAG: hypothetical protein AAF827_15290 [Cyanobacteria bacterium P01_D01_bin.6]